MSLNQVIRAAQTHEETDTTAIESTMNARFNSNRKELMSYVLGMGMRQFLPYGIWTLSDGSEIVFNREYQPIRRRDKDGVLSYADQNEWIENIDTVRYLYDDGNTPVNPLIKHFGQVHINSAKSKEYKKSLMICMQVLRDYTPKESTSVSRKYSLTQLG